MQQTRSIYVIDDDALQREAIGLVVGTTGWKVQTFGTAEECLSTLARERCDCVVVDLMMPGMSGADFLEVLMARGMDIPAVVITGVANDSPLARRALEAGARVVLIKTCRPEEIVSAVERALGAKRNPRFTT
jgi:FixJ family two-component response regulator